MTRKEFEDLAMKRGLCIPQELYERVEKMYMKTNEVKWTFVDRVFGKENDAIDIMLKLDMAEKIKTLSTSIKEKEGKCMTKKDKELKRIARKKDDFLGVRMTKIEKEIIKHFASVEGLTASDFMRRVSIEYVARRVISLKGEQKT